MRLLVILLFMPVTGIAKAQYTPVIPEYGTKTGDFNLIALAGPPVTPTWHKQPEVAYIIWIHPTLKTIKDAEGVPLADRIKEFHCNLYTLGSVIFYEGPYDVAQTRYYYADQGVTQFYSRSFANFENGQASSLFAVNTINGRDIWLCDLNKGRFGNTKRSGLGLVRTIGHAWFFSKGWPEQGYKSAHKYLGRWYPADDFAGAGKTKQGYRNPNQSVGIYWPYTEAGLHKYGRAGCDDLERAWYVQFCRSLGGKTGSAWLWKHEDETKYH